MDEYLDIWDADGQPTGKKCLKDEAHQKGWFHTTVHIWFYTNTPSLLLQKRSLNKQTFPGLWDVSVAGHVIAGESIIDGALREIKEEIGLDIKEIDLILLEVRKNTNRFDNGIIDETEINLRCSVFGARYGYKLERFLRKLLRIQTSKD